MSEYIFGVQNKALASSILLTSLRDDYDVVHAPTLASTAAVIAHVAVHLASGGLKPKPVSAAAGVLGKRPRHHWRISRDGRVTRLQVRVRLQARRGERGGGGGHYTQEWKARWERGCKACEALLLLIRTVCVNYHGALNT
jgi:hypothetical protein